MIFENKQAVFDHVVTFLRKQKVQSKESDGNCCYSIEQPDGPPLHCAVGCLAPDAEWEEGARITDASKNQKIVKRLCPFKNSILLVNRLQAMHDAEFCDTEKADLPLAWERRFAAFAREHNLTLLPNI